MSVYIITSYIHTYFLFTLYIHTNRIHITLYYTYTIHILYRICRERQTGLLGRKIMDILIKNRPSDPINRLFYQSDWF